MGFTATDWSNFAPDTAACTDEQARMASVLVNLIVMILILGIQKLTATSNVDLNELLTRMNKLSISDTNTEILDHSQKVHDKSDFKPTKDLMADGETVMLANISHDSSPLACALQYGLPSVECLSEANANINQQDSKGCTALIWATCCGRERIVKYLLRNGALVNLASDGGFTPLHYACWQGFEKIALLLLMNGANINACDNFGNTVLNALLLSKELWNACESNAKRDVGANRWFRVLKALLDHKVNVNAPDQDGNFPLMAASRLRLTNFVRRLTKSGAKVDPQAGRQFAAFDTHLKFNDYEILDCLLSSGMPADLTAVDGSTLLHLACSKGSYIIANLLIQHKANVNHVNNRGNIPLNSLFYSEELPEFCVEKIALYYKIGSDKWFETLVCLIENGGNINWIDGKERSLLMIACKRERLDFIRYLANSGALLDERLKNGYRIIDIASIANQDEVVACLLANNALMDSVRQGGPTPLHLACSHGSADAARMLLQNGANVDQRDDRGNTPLNRMLSQMLKRSGQKELPEIAKRPDKWLETTMVLIEYRANLGLCDDFKDPPLLSAVYLGRINIIKALINGNANVNQKNEDGVCPLRAAISLNNDKIVKYLLRKDANVNWTCRDGNTPLHYACINGYYRIAQILLERASCIDLKNNLGHTPLHMLLLSEKLPCWENSTDFQEDICKVDKWVKTLGLLIQHGADIDMPSNKKNSPLMIAAAAGRLDLVILLLKSGAMINWRNKEGFDAFLRAILKRKYKVADYLLKNRAFTNVTRTEMGKLLHQQCIELSTTGVKLLLQYRINVDCLDRRGNSPLGALLVGEKPLSPSSPMRLLNLLTMSKNWKKMIKTLILYGANLNIADENNNFPLRSAVMLERIDVVRILINAKANVNQQYGHGKCALHLASALNNYDITDYLLSSNAIVDLADNDKNSSLHFACSSGAIATIRLLLCHGAKVDHRNNHGNTPLQTLLSSKELKRKCIDRNSLLVWKEILEMLIEHGADTNIFNNRGDSPLIIASRLNQSDIMALLIESKAVIEQQTKAKHGVLAEAVYKNSYEVTNYLLRNKALVDFADIYGVTPLHKACRGGHVNIVKLLLRYKANVQYQTKYGRVPLHFLLSSDKLTTLEGPATVSDIWSKHNKWLETLKCLIYAGANVNEPDINGNTPIVAATISGRLDLVQYLVEARAEIKPSGQTRITALAEAAILEKYHILECLLNNLRTEELESNNEVTIYSIDIVQRIAQLFFKYGKNVASNENNRIHLLFYLLNNNINRAKQLWDNGARLSISNGIDSSQDLWPTLKLVELFSERFPKTILYKHFLEPRRFSRLPLASKQMLNEKFELSESVSERLAIELASTPNHFSLFGQRIQNRKISKIAAFFQMFCNTIDSFKKTLDPLYEYLKLSNFEFIMYMLEQASHYLGEKKSRNNNARSRHEFGWNLNFMLRDLGLIEWFAMIFEKDHVGKLRYLVDKTIMFFQRRLGPMGKEKRRFLNELLFWSPFVIERYFQDAKNMIELIMAMRCDK